MPPVDVIQGAETESDEPLTPEVEQAAEAVAPEAVDTEGGATDATPEATTDGDLVVTIGDESPEAHDDGAAPQWVRDLRKSDREKTRRIRELETRLQQAQPAQEQVTLGPKPTLAGCDYDEEKYASALESWHERRTVAEQQQRAAERAQAEQAAAWQRRLDGYRAQAASMRIPGFAEAEQVVKDSLSVVQQGLIIKACKQPALMVAALGNNEARARQLAAIADPVEFVAEVARLETQLKTQARKPATAPERAVPRSSVAGAAAVDDQLSKLQAQAAKTGDRTPVVRYLQGKAKQAA